MALKPHYHLTAGLWAFFCAGFALNAGFSLAVSDNAAFWRGVLRDGAGNPLSGVPVVLHRSDSKREFTSTTDPSGVFTFSEVPPGVYFVSVRWQGLSLTNPEPVEIRANARLEFWLELVTHRRQVLLHHSSKESQSGGGERLSSQEVANLPLNKRDYSKLLTLDAGTTTDTNSGAVNFTQQFAANGQRGTAAVFAIDAVEATDPEQGGATFSNFNVDAIKEVRSSSGVMPAEIGHGAAVFTNVITKSGTNEVHGTVFEFHRNAALDARNFFDRRTVANPGRLPPFIRNEFGLTNGGPVVLPGVYDGRDRTFYFGQYQGFREVLGTTQVLAVPTANERRGINTTAFPGDTLTVPVSPLIAPILSRYPLPNDAQGPYGPRTYATSSKITTNTDQFSVRIDHKLSEKAQLFARFSLNNVDGPLTNPNQTAIDPSFAIRFLDRQRNFALTYTRALSTQLVSESTFGFLRTTPLFPTLNHTQPALNFADGLYEAFNTPGGQALGTFGNLFQARQGFAYVRGAHNIKIGFEGRFNLDSTVFAFYPNGQYIFGGGTAYSPVEIRSASGLRDIHPGDPLPDSLSSFLTATPFSYTTSAAPPIFPQGDRLGLSAIRRESYNFYFQDTWKVTPRFSLNYGLRYEVNTRIREANKLTSAVVFGNSIPSEPVESSAPSKFVVNPQPPYVMDWRGVGPRIGLQWQVGGKTVLRAGGAIVTSLPNLFQDNSLVATFPFVYNPYITATPNSPVTFRNAVARFDLPPIYTPSGKPIYASGNSKDVAPNTEVDLQRFQNELALSTGQAVSPISLYVMSPDFRNGYIASYTAGLEHDFGDIKLNAAYVGTAGVKLSSLFHPNGYAGADPAFAPFTRFDANGQVMGGLGPFSLMASRGHSSFHSLQTSLGKTSTRAGFAFQVSYTFSKALDDASSALGGAGSGSSGVQLQSAPQDPRNWRAEKGPSTFNINHAIAFSFAQSLPLGHLPVFQRLGHTFTTGWKLMNISTLTSGSPFSVYSGIQQTGSGSNRADRPDQVGQPTLSTRRIVREDYFGMGGANTSYFFIPIGLPDGTGPNRGRPGTLGRNTFRGPGFHNFDISLIKDTPIGQRGGGDALTLQFRAEFFNIFNLVNFGLPANVLRGTGFGLINRTAGPSRQLQFSVKLIY